MQTQFWKNLKEEIYFIFLGKIVGIIIIIFTVITILVSSHFWFIWHHLLYFMPVIIVIMINCLIFIALYQYNQTIQSGIQSRQTMIKTTFETIHNGPLQTLAKVLRLIKRKDLPINNLLPLIEKELEELNQELRGMYELWQQETLTQDTSLYLGNNVVIDLRNPLPEILYQVYSYTLERDFPCFKTLKLKIHSFEPIYESNLSIENKRGLCRFLEEALCNVGKHATDITCLQVTYSWLEDQRIYTLSIIDNGLGIYPLKEGWGTKQFKNLAQQINGKFRRVSLYPQGTLCELSWPLANSFWWQ